MSGYVVLARKWRPAQFSDIVGQGATIRTLSNAVESDRIHHAYLFTGSRGVGKTSIARIFSKVLRCEHRKTFETPSGAHFLASCDECSNCKEIASGTSLDVIEIDGASNNGVENVRDIRESAKFAPSRGSKKIYIIDEVHMLTTAAFNALLKTLEEPPPHVVFVFATTEPHKIPATILSRCQRFDFKRVTVAQIMERLKTIVEKEGLSADPAALSMIARAAEGSMRDSLSLLDQVVAFSGREITAAGTRESLGLVESELVLGILEDVLSRQAPNALEKIDQAYARGHDLRTLAKNLLEALHAAILIKVGAKIAESSFDFSEVDREILERVSALRPLEELELIFQVIHYGIESLARSSQPKILLDLLLIKCAAAEALVSIENAAPVSGGSGGSQPIKATPSAASEAFAPSTQVNASSPPAHGAKDWESFIAFVKAARPSLAAVLEHALTPEFPAERVEIRFRTEDSFKRDQIEGLYGASLKDFLKRFLGADTAFSTQVLASNPMQNPAQGSAQPPVSTESLADKKQRAAETQRKETESKIQNHPIIREARSLFGAEMGSIEIRNVQPEDAE